jgi:hypothetical protein
VLPAAASCHQQPNVMCHSGTVSNILLLHCCRHQPHRQGPVELQASQQ